ncbi:hypothetical protein X777_13003 [Ooceraea biroi]|uniref:Uncharacterized protein n=1 Tax=Ooceraea biroi TaxID=2015173 RepID=A0A026VXH4_OOCBI|nr:hypothetical protein X777_13003 [Ooceraea biroi]
MDQASSMGHPGWIRDEVAIHFDIFTVRTVRLREWPSRYGQTEEEERREGEGEGEEVVGFSLYLLE